MTCCRLTSCWTNFFGSTCTCRWGRRSPQMATWATPGTRNNRARIFQYAIVDMSVRFTVSEVSPIFMIRLVEDSAGIMNGGLAHVGRVAVIWASRSATSWRARSSSVPRPKISTMEDSWATDLDLMSSSPSIPFSWFSIGTVINCSTSLEELPSAMVWISTRGGANSGKTSTSVSGIRTNPKAIMAAATNSTIQRKARLLATIRRISTHPYRSLVFACDVEFCAVHLGGTGRDDLYPRGRSDRQRRPVPLDPVDRDLHPHEGQGFGNGVHPALSLLVVDECRIVDGDTSAGGSYRGGLQPKPLGGVGGERHRLHTSRVGGSKRRRCVLGPGFLVAMSARRSRHGDQDRRQAPADPGAATAVRSHQASDSRAAEPRSRRRLGQ